MSFFIGLAFAPWYNEENANIGGTPMDDFDDLFGFDRAFEDDLEDDNSFVWDEDLGTEE